MARRHSTPSFRAVAAASALSLGAWGCTDLSLCSEGLCAASASADHDDEGHGGATPSSSTAHGGAGGSAPSSTSAGGGASTSAGGSGSTSISTTSSGGPPTTATILALRPDETPVAGVDVVVNDLDGAVILRAMTGGDGQLTVSLPHGGSATVYRTMASLAGLRHAPLTIVAPPDGVVIRVAMESSGPPPPSGTAFDATAIGVPIHPAAVTFFGSCGAKESSPATLGFTCASAAEHATSEAIIAVATTLTGVPAAWGSMADLAVLPGASVDVELSVTHEDFAVIHTAMTHVGLDATSAEVELRSLASALGRSGPIVSHKKTWLQPVGDLVFTAKVPAASWGFHLKEKLASATGSVSRELWRERRWSALPGESELSGELMPALTLAALDLADPAHPRLDWEVAPCGDVTVATMEFGEPDAAVRWTAWLPVEASGHFELPDIPLDLRPPALSFGLPPVEAMAACADLEQVDSYAQALASGAAAWVTEPGAGAGSFTATVGRLKNVP